MPDQHRDRTQPQPPAQTLARALITGLLLAGVIWWLHAILDGGFTRWRLFWLVLFGGTLIAWALLLFPRRQAQPAQMKKKAQDTLSLALNWNDGHTGTWIRSNLDKKQFITFCYGAAAGLSLGETHWTGRGAPFTKPQYIRFRDLLLLEGMIRQKNGHRTGGYELSGKGKAMTNEVLRRFPPREHSPHQFAAILSRLIEREKEREA